MTALKYLVVELPPKLKNNLTHHKLLLRIK